MTAFDHTAAKMTIKPAAATPVDNRTLFYRLQQEIIDDAALSAAKNLLIAKLNALPACCHRADDIGDLAASPLKPLTAELATARNIAAALYQTSPVLLTQPAWLQQICLAGVSHITCNIGLMKVYDCLTRNAAGQFDLIHCRQALLEQSGHKIYAPACHLFGQQTQLLPAIWDFAAVQLALGRFPQHFLAEILGFSLAYCQSATLIEQCFPDQLSHPFFMLHRQHQQRALPRLTTVINDYLRLHEQQKATLYPRIRQGFGLFQQQSLVCREQLHDLFSQPVSIEQHLGRIFQQKLAAARGHHGHIQLGGHSLEWWLKQLPARLEDFLTALRQSDYVDPQQPENSRLLALFAPGGPMTGVLNAGELNILRRWLTGEKTDWPALVASTQRPIEIRSAAVSRSKPFSLRESYHKLVNQDLDQASLGFLERRLSRQLRFCHVVSHPPFRHFEPESFERHFQKLYQREMAAYRPLQGQPKISRPAYLWGLQQIAPMVLIDGCWLQHCLKLQTSHTEICELLFSIYSDELGNGSVEHNHPLIFRRLLDSLSIQLPAVDSKAFAAHPALIDSAFDLPVFMLALSNFPKRYLAELLGLNLAIEISGLGRHYLTLVDEWRYWGIDSTIADVHITIDNVASGHTFLAKQAIHLYLDEIRQKTADPCLLDHHWRRIWTGYSALRVIGWRFKLLLPCLYLFRKSSIRHQHVE